jgi:hypothetical protein
MIFFVRTTSNSLNPKKVVVKHQSAEDRLSTSNKLLYPRVYKLEKKGGFAGEICVVRYGQISATPPRETGDKISSRLLL